jgi:hypothetical protein
MQSCKKNYVLLKFIELWNYSVQLLLFKVFLFTTIKIYVCLNENKPVNCIICCLQTFFLLIQMCGGIESVSKIKNKLWLLEQYSVLVS